MASGDVHGAADRGAQGREVEIKLDLDAETYRRILELLPPSGPERRQRNVFFDSEDGTLQRTRWALRIRGEVDGFTLTVKGKRERAREGVFDRVERESAVPVDRARTWLDGFRLSDTALAPCEELRERFGDLAVRPFLSFVNHRTPLAFGSWTLELDRMEAGGKEMYELELELDPTDAAQAEAQAEAEADLRGLFAEHGWPYRPSRQSKMQKALGAES